MKKLAIATIVAAAFSAPAFAGDIYVVGSVGQSYLHQDKAQIDNTVAEAGATGISSTLNNKDIGYKLQLGYQFNQNFAVEGGWVDLGKVKYSASYAGGSANASTKASGFNVAAVGILPVNESFSLFGKLGVIDGKVEETVSATGPGGSANASEKTTKWKGNYGVGATYNINKQVGVRAEYERFSKLGDSNTTGTSDVDLFSLGAVFKF